MCVCVCVCAYIIKFAKIFNSSCIVHAIVMERPVRIELTRMLYNLMFCVTFCHCIEPNK